MYETTNDGEEIQLINKKYLDDISLILIDNKTIKKSSLYKFNNKGEYEVLFGFNKSLESTDEMFKDCKNLRSLNFSNFKTSEIKNMNGMFNRCYSLKSLNLSNFVTKKVTNMSYLFNECYAIGNIILDNFDTSNVVDMKYMFADCVSLPS